MEREPRAGATTETQPAADADALTLSQVEAVLRRAAQLDARQRAPRASGLAPEELTRIALEAGVSADAVDAALRELQLGTLGQERKPTLLDERLGPRTVRSARVVDLAPDAA